MTQPSERVAAACPACASDAPTPHELLSPGGRATVRCADCGHIHKSDLTEPPTVDRQVVVSQDGDSFTARVDAPADETVAVGEEFLLDTEEAIMEVRITDLQLASERRVDEAIVADVDTFWTRAVGNVSVNLTLHPEAGAGRHTDTRSTTLFVPGDERFIVGEVNAYGDERFLVEGLVLRDDASGYDHHKLDFDGDRAPAKDIARVYARDRTTSAWSAW